jgi:hypothetical protein
LIIQRQCRYPPCESAHCSLTIYFNLAPGTNLA